MIPQFYKGSGQDWFRQHRRRSTRLSSQWGASRGVMVQRWRFRIALELLNQQRENHSQRFYAHLAQPRV